MSSSLLLLLLVLALVFCLSEAITPEKKPVIGIFTTPSDFKEYPANNHSYIADAYVDYIQDAGADIVPIPYDASPENITFLLNRVNGIIFTGGDADLNYTNETSRKIEPTKITQVFGKAIRDAILMNRNGTYFPVLALCQGWEILMMTLSDNYDILRSNYKEKNNRNTLEFITEPLKSLLWKSMPDELLEEIQKNDVFYFKYRSAITPWVFEASGGISTLLKMTTLSKPKNGGQVTVASAEGRRVPIYGFQFHPEKNGYVKGKDVNVSHTDVAVKAAAHISNFFIEEARKNHHTFESDSLLQASLIKNWMVVPIEDVTFDKAYIFDSVSEKPWSYPNLHKRY